jgi:LEA14-like dessication related protein
MIPRPLHPSPRPSRLVLLLPLLAVLACASLVEEPQVALAAVELHSIGLTGATVRVELQVTNPNRFSLDARAMEYTLSFAEPDAVRQDGGVDDEQWSPVASGRTAEGVVLAARDSTPVVVDVPFRYGAVGRAVGSLLQSGRLHYRFHGSFTVGSPVGELRIPFDRTGLLDP